MPRLLLLKLADPPTKIVHAALVAAACRVAAGCARACANMTPAVDRRRVASASTLPFKFLCFYEWGFSAELALLNEDEDVDEKHHDPSAHYFG